MKRSIQAVACAVLLVTMAGQARAEIITHDQEFVARQQVNLLGVEATLVASGIGSFTFDVDSNGNTPPGSSSTVDTLFQGFLPSEFVVFGLDGRPFDLFSLNPELVTTSGNGTHVSVVTTFGLRVYASLGGPTLAEFFTEVPSLFETDVNSLTDFTGAVFQDPARPVDPTVVFIGNNPFGLDVGTPVGVSFDRTVSAVPEPASITLVGISIVGLGLGAFRRRANTSAAL